MTLAEFELLSFAERRAVIKRLLRKERHMARKAAAAAGLPDAAPISDDGHWTFIRPTEPGWYWLADREGNARGIRQLVHRTQINGKRLLCEAGIPHNEPGWQGYWYSEPIDQPPPKAEEPS